MVTRIERTFLLVFTISLLDIFSAPPGAVSWKYLRTSGSENLSFIPPLVKSL
jgi:hypothetical protein